MANDKLELIEKKTLSLIQKIKNDDDSIDLILAISFLSIFLLLVSAWHFIKFTIIPIVIVAIVITVVLLIIFKIKMGRATAKNKDKSNYIDSTGKSKEVYVNALLEYLYTGIQVKLTRTVHVRNFYIIVFPLILLILRETVIGRFTPFQLVLNAITLYLSSYLIWTFFYKFTIEELRHAGEDVHSMLDEVRATYLSQ